MSNVLMLRRPAAKPTPVPSHLRHDLSSPDEAPADTPGLVGEIGHPSHSVSCSGYMVAVG